VPLPQSNVITFFAYMIFVFTMNRYLVISAVGIWLGIYAVTPTTAQFQPLQSPRSVARSGNEAYTNGRYKEAEQQYRTSLKQDKNLTEGAFNLGDALYKQGKFDEAADQFRLLADNSKAAKEIRAQSYHNLGNALFKSQKLQECIDAYKNALRNNPTDEDTRANLSQALRLLAEQQKDNDKKNDNNKQDQQKQQQDQQQKQDQQKQDQQKQDQQKQDQQKQPPVQQGNQPQPKLSKADAERILEALNNDERTVQKKLIKRKATGVMVEKDW
jgi:Ca-activated chloride channel homolog